MKKTFLVTTILILCFVPLVFCAGNDAIDNWSIEFGLGSVCKWEWSSGNFEAKGLILGSGPTLLNVGLFIFNGLSIGGAASYITVKDEGATESYEEFFFGPIVRFYIPISDKYLANIEGIFQFDSWEFPGDTDKSSLMRYGGGGGITYLITNNLGMYGSVHLFFIPDYKDQGIEVPDSNFTLIDAEIGFRVFL